MRHATGWLMSGFLAALAGVVLLTPHSPARDIGFVEDFALAKDRIAALKQLIPGTEDFYYYHCLHYLNSGQFEKIEPQTKLWHERHGQTARLTEIQTRHALLDYEKNPKRTLAYVRSRLGLRFDHQKEVARRRARPADRARPTLISRDTLKAMSLRRWNTLDNFEDTALEWLAADDAVLGEPPTVAPAAHAARRRQPAEARRATTSTPRTRRRSARTPFTGR